MNRKNGKRPKMKENTHFWRKFWNFDPKIPKIFEILGTRFQNLTFWGTSPPDFDPRVKVCLHKIYKFDFSSIFCKLTPCVVVAVTTIISLYYLQTLKNRREEFVRQNSSCRLLHLKLTAQIMCVIVTLFFAVELPKSINSVLLAMGIRWKDFGFWDFFGKSPVKTSNTSHLSIVDSFLKVDT